MFRVFAALCFLVLVGCSHEKESPTIYFTNASLGIIKDVRCAWGEKNSLTLQGISPGDSRAKSFYIKRSSDFFGPKTVSWINPDNKKITKEFNFEKARLPSISEKRSFAYVQIYFLQDDIEVIGSDDNGADEKTRAREIEMAKNKKEAEERGIFAACVPNRINLYNCPGNSAQNSLIILHEQPN